MVPLQLMASRGLLHVRTKSITKIDVVATIFSQCSLACNNYSPKLLQRSLPVQYLCSKHHITSTINISAHQRQEHYDSFVTWI
uniref:Uncharacterized protein n=1 Tax=Hyaloperonospora arabidopsidis (strain Emoy2) TaxID=559515 RepID=M4B4M1_HYAAE